MLRQSVWSRQTENGEVVGRLAGQGKTLLGNALFEFPMHGRLQGEKRILVLRFSVKAPHRLPRSADGFSRQTPLTALHLAICNELSARFGFVLPRVHLCAVHPTVTVRNANRLSPPRPPLALLPSFALIIALPSSLARSSPLASGAGIRARFNALPAGCAGLLAFLSPPSIRGKRDGPSKQSRRQSHRDQTKARDVRGTHCGGDGEAVETVSPRRGERAPRVRGSFPIENTNRNLGHQGAAQKSAMCFGAHLRERAVPRKEHRLQAVPFMGRPG